MDIVTGEKIQLLADIFVGHYDDFNYNQFIANQRNPHQLFVHIPSIPNYYDNPNIVFCFGHRLEELSVHIHKFKNPFTLVSHNSDYNITNCQSINLIVNCEKVIKLCGQNVLYVHDTI